MGYARVFQAYETALEGDVRLRLRAMSLKHMVRHIGIRSSKYKYGAQLQSKVLLVILNFPISPSIKQHRNTPKIFHEETKIFKYQIFLSALPFLIINCSLVLTNVCLEKLV